MIVPLCPFPCTGSRVVHIPLALTVSQVGLGCIHGIKGASAEAAVFGTAQSMPPSMLVPPAVAVPREGVRVVCVFAACFLTS